LFSFIPSFASVNKNKTIDIFLLFSPSQTQTRCRPIGDCPTPNLCLAFSPWRRGTATPRGKLEVLSRSIAWCRRIQECRLCQNRTHVNTPCSEVMTETSSKQKQITRLTRGHVPAPSSHVSVSSLNTTTTQHNHPCGTTGQGCLCSRIFDLNKFVCGNRWRRGV